MCSLFDPPPHLFLFVLSIYSFWLQSSLEGSSFLKRPISVNEVACTFIFLFFWSWLLPHFPALYCPLPHTHTQREMYACTPFLTPSCPLLQSRSQAARRLEEISRASVRDEVHSIVRSMSVAPKAHKPSSDEFGRMLGGSVVASNASLL